MKDWLSRLMGGNNGDGRWWRNKRIVMIGGGAALVVALLTIALVTGIIPLPRTVQPTAIAYSEFKARLKAGQIISVVIDESQNIVGRMIPAGASSDQAVLFSTRVISTGDPKLSEEMEAAHVQFAVSTPPATETGTLFLVRVLPLLVIGALGFMVYKRSAQMSGGVGGLLQNDRRKASEVKPADVSVKFCDVGGADEAITELQEIITFLKEPERFARLGGRVPKGVLLVGPPGTGKTLLAKATAGEAGVRFFEANGSEFMEMFVGVGAARVRSLFEQARKAAPAVVFIDEIDSIGMSRGAGGVRSGANDERDQTLNQLLAEIDGFRAGADQPVVIMAATNRPEVLDQALLRAGRFDRQVAVGQPDLVGRLQVLTIHSRSVTLADDFDLERAARMTPGFTGADLANVMNEAALLAARRGAESVDMSDFEAAIERVVAGLERKTRIMNERERAAIAYHESGHALIAELCPHADPVAKLSIVPRGRGALGYMMQMPMEDRYLFTVEEITDRVAVMMAGRAAEQVVLGTITTGASDDIHKATEMAQRMVLEYGMSEKLGCVRYAGQHLQYLEGGVSDTRQVSPKVRETIDDEVKRIITEQYDRAQELLRRHRDALECLTQQLLHFESLDGAVVRQILADARPLM